MKKGKSSLSEITRREFIAATAAAAAGASIARAKPVISKGVDYYGYIARSSFAITYQFPDDWGKKTTTQTDSNPEAMYNGNYQISESDIGLTEHTGRYKWTAKLNNNEITNRYVEIAPSTGNMGKTNLGDSMLSTTSIINKDSAVSFGFYDAGAGIGSLTNQDQSYVYVTDNYSTWMGDLAKEMDLSKKPFARFALPGVHDAGMFDPSRASGMTGNATWLGLLGGVIGLSLAKMAQSAVMRSVINFAFTQKDKISTMLDLGIRYFDFRPGYLYPKLDNNLYHQHDFIPGYPYASFLKDVLSWLKAHPTEIVVVSLGFAGFYSHSAMDPSVSTLSSYLDNAMTATGTKGVINTGNKNDLQTSISDLLASKKRLIFLNQVKGSDDATKYDSYSDAYKTTDVNVVIRALNGMTKSGQTGYDYTVLQLQGTAQGTGGGIYKSIATLSNFSSPLMSTKGMFDNATYPWLRANVASRFDPNKTIVFLNDFGDNALVSHAIAITKSRMQAK